MKPKIGQKLEGFDSTISPEGQVVKVGNLRLTPTNTRGNKVLWEYVPSETNVIPLREDDPSIPYQLILGISIITRGEVVKSIWIIPTKVYGDPID